LDEIGPGDGVLQFDVVKDEKTSFVSEEADSAYDLWLPPWPHPLARNHLAGLAGWRGRQPNSLCKF